MQRFVPEAVRTIRSGYAQTDFVKDLIAGLTVAIIALPLAMAFGIASIPEEAARAAGISPPAVGLITAIVAGFLISALGGSRVQVGGPTGAFIVIIYGVTQRHGYDGLAAATLMAGVIVLIMSISGLGRVIKFIPYPVTTGFTTGIAVIIASSQVRDFFGLQLESVPADFIEKWRAYAGAASTWGGPSLAVGGGSLLLLILLRHIAPRIPGAIVVVAFAAAVVAIFDLPVATIGAKFGDIPRTFPPPALPHLSFDLIRELIPDATTIAILIAIESLLSAVVADGLTGWRHRSDTELFGQGVANIASVVFGGIPATGAIARTAANIKSGARTPVAGMLHAVFLLIFMLALAAPAKLIPLPTLAAILLLVAWNMSEKDHFLWLLRAPRSDVAVLLTTFGLTVFADLTIAVGVGMVLASLLFMKRMTDVAHIGDVSAELNGGDGDDDPDGAADVLSLQRRIVPPGVEVYEINGPFFFGVADRLKDVLDEIERPPHVFILRLRRVPHMDATGLHALREFEAKCRREGTRLVLSGVRPELRASFVRSGFEQTVGPENILPDIDAALARAAALL